MIPRIDVDFLCTGTPQDELLEKIAESGHSRFPVYSESIDNVIGVLYVKDLIAAFARKTDFRGLCFANLVDFDMLYGHRQDIDGYAKALSEFDAWLPEFMAGMQEGDVLMITADHGCDPGDNSTDHTREMVPLIIYGAQIKPCNMETHVGFANIGKLACDLLKVEYQCDDNTVSGVML